MRIRLRPRLVMAIGFVLLGTIAVPDSAASSKELVGVGRADDGCLPNLMVILVDDLGFGDLSVQGAEDLQTPAIDALFARGIRFHNFYANCPVCSPTRAALLSGRYQDFVGVPGVIRPFPENSWGDLSDEAVLLPARLKPAGYHCALVGKWHLGPNPPDTPLDRGFDQFEGFISGMMDDYYTHKRRDFNTMRRGREEIDPEGHATELLSDWASAYLNDRAEQPDQPFFLYLAYNAPHVPVQPPESWLNSVLRREPEIDQKRAALVALIEHLDDGIGRVLATLERTGLAENTLVVFTSDNGGQLNVGANNGPWRGTKGTVYEGGIRVPAAIAWPGRIAPGSETDLMAMSMDLAPTLCEVAGVEVPEIMDGVSLVPTLIGEDQGPLRELTFFRRREGGFDYAGKTIDAVRRGDWKLLQNSPFGPRELYNLAEDPGETRDRAADRPRIVRQLSSALQAQIQRYGSVPWQPQRP